MYLDNIHALFTTVMIENSTLLTLGINVLYILHYLDTFTATWWMRYLYYEKKPHIV